MLDRSKLLRFCLTALIALIVLQECGANVCGYPSQVSFFRCRMSDNGCHGLHVNTGASAKVHASDILRNGQSGIAIIGMDDREKREGTGGKVSEGHVMKSRVAGNEWQAVLVLDGSLHLEDCDVRRNARGALVSIHSWIERWSKKAAARVSSVSTVCVFALAIECVNV